MTRYSTPKVYTHTLGYNVYILKCLRANGKVPALSEINQTRTPRRTPGRTVVWRHGDSCRYSRATQPKLNTLADDYAATPTSIFGLGGFAADSGGALAAVSRALLTAVTTAVRVVRIASKKTPESKVACGEDGVRVRERERERAGDCRPGGASYYRAKMCVFWCI